MIISVDKKDDNNKLCKTNHFFETFTAKVDIFFLKIDYYSISIHNLLLTNFFLSGGGYQRRLHEALRVKYFISVKTRR